MNLNGIDPSDITMQILDKNPRVRYSDGTELMPDPRSLEWSPVTLVPNPSECEHVETACATCSDSWGIDYYIKIFVKGDLVWNSPDLPIEPPTGEN